MVSRYLKSLVFCIAFFFLFHLGIAKATQASQSETEQKKSSSQSSSQSKKQESEEEEENNSSTSVHVGFASSGPREAEDVENIGGRGQ